MILLNRSPVASIVLDRLLVAAGRRVGARTERVAVQVNPGSGLYSSGVARECDQVRWDAFPATSFKRREPRWVNTDGGAFRIVLPIGRGSSYGTDLRPRSNADISLDFYEVACHEWVHILEYQNGGRRRFVFSSPGPSGRRPRHRDRPEEIRVVHRLRDLSIDDHALYNDPAGKNRPLVDALAAALEEIRPR